ncbi:hypothetical protein EDB81DRAFT_767099 [Dactylonectria macrodidyma]|uniref:VCBS repeat-containing protein n=1 Tax=Dactylonectria macrodidyma TaxID=307937 RepID=A0A9P9DFK5_9HYPO|nr:hypothetical protein EDB81DRAFT_767099 [Dactylonectria macrodidyma]
MLVLILFERNGMSPSGVTAFRVPRRIVIKIELRLRSFRGHRAHGQRPCFDTYGTYDGARIRLGDVDGSGATDIIYLGATGVDIYMNQAGNGFADSKKLVHFPRSTMLPTVTGQEHERGRVRLG